MIDFLFHIFIGIFFAEALDAITSVLQIRVLIMNKELSVPFIFSILFLTFYYFKILDSTK